jgi:3-hydroxybutyryl-CoA dehydrogenase
MKRPMMESLTVRKSEVGVSKQIIGIVGGGLMGHGIAYLFAAAGHQVGVYEPHSESRASMPGRLRKIVELFDRDATLLDHIAVYGELAPATAEAAFVFEAAPERLPLKQEIFAELEGIVPADTVLASNSSAIPSTHIARRLKGRERVVGTHFWNPPHLVPLVEVVQNEWTASIVVERTMALLRSVGKTPVHVRRDIPGFVGNRLQHALKREAIAILADGVCDAETIDTVVKQGLGSRMAILGPMEQSDLVGLDLTLDIANVLYSDLDRTPGPHPYLQAKVRDGHLGMKTGQGFRKWTVAEADAVRAQLSQFLVQKAKGGTFGIKERGSDDEVG